MAETDPDRVAALEQQVAELQARLDELHDNGETGTGRTRREVLGSMAAGGILGGLAGAGSAAGATGTGAVANVGGVTANTYRITGNWYGGPGNARTELTSELGSADTGARYGADDTGEWYYWTGSSWDLLPESNVRYAQSPDDISDILAAEGGDTPVILQPGDYDENDWTSTITIPRVEDVGPQIDMSHATVTFGTDQAMPDPLIEFPRAASPGIKDRASGFITLPRTIDGDVLSNANAGTVLEMWDLVNSQVRVPYVIGQWDIVVDHGAEAGSNHANLIHAYANKADKLFRIRDISGLGNDRSWYFGQHALIGDTSVDVVSGANNVFWVQPENERSDATGTTTGYHLQTSAQDNTIMLCHRLPETPLLIEATGTSLGPNVYSNGEIMDKSSIGECHLIGQSNLVRLSDMRDETPLYTTSNVTQTNFGDYQLNAGTASSAHIRSGGRQGNLSTGPFMIQGVLDPDQTSDFVAKAGIWSDSNNWVMLVADSTNTNWRFQVNDSGTIVDDVDTGVGIAANPFRFSVKLGDTDSTGIHTAHLVSGSGTEDIAQVGTSTNSRSHMGSPQQAAIDITAQGSPGSDRTMGISDIVHGTPVA